jgi:hypothetical protein
MTRTIHFVAALAASALIFTFFVCTIAAELLGEHELVAWVKHLIVFPGLFFLVPAIATAGITGFLLARRRSGARVQAKKKRMPIIGVNGIVVLVPCAILLDRWAAGGRFDTVFWLVQTLELLAGFVNLSLMGLNLRDGLKLSGKWRASGSAQGLA